MSNKTITARSKSSSRKSSSEKTLKANNLSSILKANVPKLSSPLTEEELGSSEIRPRDLANVALRNNGQSVMDLFVSNPNVTSLFRKIGDYNLRETATLSFEFFLVKLKDEYFYFYLDDETPIVLPLKTSTAESKFIVLLDKLDGVIKTSGFKLCSSVLSKSYIQHCLKYSDYFVMAFGIHKRDTKLKIKLSREGPNTKLSNIVGYDCLGFAFLERYKKSKDSIYLQAICSNKGFGDRIFKFTELVSEFMLFNKLYLSAVDTALAYYISRGYEVIINRRIGKNLKYIIDPSDRKSIKTPIPGSKELYGFQGSLMFKSTKSKKSTKVNSVNNSTTSTVRRSSRSRKRLDNSSKPRQYVLQNVSFDSDDNINMVKELNQLQ